MRYRLIVDEKIEVWKRTYVNVEADNLKSAIEKCKEENYEVTNNEILYDTERYLKPEEVDGPTREIYHIETNQYEPIYTNDPYKQ